MKQTVIARAANEQGAGIEAKYANIEDEDAVRLVEETGEGSIREGIAKAFKEMFAEDPEQVAIVTLPYIAQTDEETIEA